MNHGGFGYKTLTGMLLVMLMCGLAGCSSLKGGGSGGAAPSGPASLYYEGFNDILIPGELKQDKKTSSTFQSRGFAAGLMVFKGRVDRGSLVAFFKDNMAKDNWKLLGSVAATKTGLLFLKETRWCVMSISEGLWDSKVEISVLPASLDTQGGGAPATFETLPMVEGSDLQN
ncbi:hypothetical protein [Desulfococcus sp.]|uniref:hypothetical protein n=1 Tax=Desulfococcus sp. TaxID=2025834 RepID=UPI00359324F0